MPVRIRNDHHYHDNEGYSFTTRSDRSRDFARRRRFGDDEDEDSGHVMSQVSSPLNLPRLGKQNRRSFSPLEFQDYQPPTRGRMQRETGPSLYRREKISGPARHALALCGELDEEDPYYKARLPATSQSHWEGGDCDDDMMMMPQSRYTPSHHYLEEDEPVMMQRSTYMTSQSNRYVDKDDTNMVERSPFSRSRKHFDNDEPIITSTMQRSKALTAPLMEDQSTEKVQRPRKRDYSGDASASYIMPVSRRRPEDEFAEEESAMRDMTAYITTRKKFAVEDDDDIQQLRNKKYQYRTRGLNRSQPIHGGDDAFERSRDRFSRAPMFDMKLRSHVIWEKMYVKFTCTIRGSPDPKVTWYHNMVAIEPMMLAPGLMKITSQYGVHTLEIFRASLEDSGTYRVSAQNHKGEISSYATLLVRRYDDGKAGYYDIKSGYNLKKPTDYPDVESLNVEESREKLENEADLVQDKLSGDKSVTSTLTYSGRSTVIGEPKYESVLEFRLPAKDQRKASNAENIEEDFIEPVRKLKAAFDPEGDDANQLEKLSGKSKTIEDRKRLTYEEFGESLLDSLGAPSLQRKVDPIVLDNVVTEDVIEVTRVRRHKADELNNDEV